MSLRHTCMLSVVFVNIYGYPTKRRQKKSKIGQLSPIQKKGNCFLHYLFLLPAEDNNTLLVTLMRTPLQQWQPLSPLQQHHCTTTTTPLNPLRRWQPDQNTREQEYDFLFYYRMTILEVYMYYGITILK